MELAAQCNLQSWFGAITRLGMDALEDTTVVTLRNVAVKSD